jgi:hypothetical protein
LFQANGIGQKETGKRAPERGSGAAADPTPRNSQLRSSQQRNGDMVRSRNSEPAYNNNNNSSNNNHNRVSESDLPILIYKEYS